MSKRNKRARHRLTTIRWRTNCHWCNAPFNEADPDSTRYPTRDHRIPKSRGGGSGIDGNLVWACRECNMLKADLMPDEFVEYMKIANDGVRHAVAYGLARNGVRYEEWRCASR